MQSVSQNNKLCFYSLTDFTDFTDLSLARLFRKPVAVSNMKICVIRAIREPKLLSMFYSLTDITDSTDLSLGRLLAMMKICVICAIREKKE